MFKLYYIQFNSNLEFMMKIGALKEKAENERRVAMTPTSASQIIKLGHECFIEENAGITSGFSDQDYINSGVIVLKEEKSLCKEVDVLIKVQPPTTDEIELLNKNINVLVNLFVKSGTHHLGNPVVIVFVIKIPHPFVNVSVEFDVIK